VRFRAAEDGKEYFAPLPPKQTNLEGCRILAYASIGDIEAGGISAELTIEKVDSQGRLDALVYIINAQQVGGPGSVASECYMHRP
jgi:hypothetical protein